MSFDIKVLKFKSNTVKSLIVVTMLKRALFETIRFSLLYSLSLSSYCIFYRIKYFFQGLEYLHKSPVQVHGSLTTRNCLVDGRWTVRLTDFGLQPFLTRLIKDGFRTENISTCIFISSNFKKKIVVNSFFLVFSIVISQSTRAVETIYKSHRPHQTGGYFQPFDGHVPSNV